MADRRGAFAFPLAGRYRDDSVIVSQRGLNLTFSFGDVPLRRFELRMQLDRRPARRAAARALYVEVYCPEVPVYGPAFIAIGLCNDEPDAAGERHLRDAALRPRAGPRTGARAG